MSSVCVDWKETQEAHVFTVEVPGLKKEEVHVIVSAEIEKCSHLQISGVRKIDEDNKYTWHLVERSRGYFDRKFKLPENAKAEEVSAAMEDGVLTVIVPKKDSGNEFHGGTIYDVFVH